MTKKERIQEKELSNALSDFVDAMRARLAQKKKEGYCGRNGKKEISNNSLLGLIVKALEEQKYVDAANMCMMLHHRKSCQKQEV